LDEGTAGSTELLEEVEHEVWMPPPWRVILHDDPVTTMDFVVWLLEHLFHKAHEDATRLMLEVHQTGAAVVTVCPRERAELYVEQVASLARPRGFPLTASCEPV
jgi:ATP-dependent Clp protease adaptor protein ClpS